MQKAAAAHPQTAHHWTEQFAAQEQAERRSARARADEAAARPRTVFLCFWDSVRPTATYMRVRAASPAITGRTPLAADAAFAGWHDARRLPGGFVDGEVVMVVPAADCDDPPWPALVVDADGGRVPANVLALRDRAQRRALVQYFGDSTYGWVGARQLERVDALSSATRRAVRAVCVRKKAWMRAFEEMQRALGTGDTDVHEALENMLREEKGKRRARKERDVKEHGGEKGTKAAKQELHARDERKKTGKQEAEPAPPKNKVRPKPQLAQQPQQPSAQTKKPLTTTTAAKTSPHPVATKPSKQKSKMCAPQNKFMIVSTMEKHRGLGVRKHDDNDSSSSEDERAEEAPKKKMFAATTHTHSSPFFPPHAHPFL